jgi:hypothetical protein
MSIRVRGKTDVKKRPGTKAKAIKARSTGDQATASKPVESILGPDL